VKLARLSTREHLTLNVLWFALNAQSSALLPLVIPAQIALFISSTQIGSTQQVAFLSWLSMGAAVISLFLPPLIGTLSDQTIGGFGRRRPYIVIGGFLLLLSTPLLVSAGNILLFVFGLLLLLLGKNILTPAYQSLIPDRVPREQRGTASGYVGGMTLLGNVVGLGLAALLLSGVTQHAASLSIIRNNAGIYYLVTAILALIGILITIFGVREVPLLSHTYEQAGKETKRLLGFLRCFVVDCAHPWRCRNFTVVFLARASLMLGLALFMTYIEYYFARVQHAVNFVEVTGIVAMLALGGAVVSGLVSGILSDRLKRRAPFVCAASVCMCLAALTFVVFPGSLATWIWPLGIVFGLGYGAYTSVDWALSIDALPSLEKASKDLGLWNASSTLPAIMAPLLGNLIINATAQSGSIALGYRLVFGAAAFFLLLAAISVLFVRERGRQQQSQSH
jgi:MFS family permease